MAKANKYSRKTLSLTKDVREPASPHCTISPGAQKHLFHISSTKGLRPGIYASIRWPVRATNAIIFYLWARDNYLRPRDTKSWPEMVSVARIWYLRPRDNISGPKINSLGRRYYLWAGDTISGPEIVSPAQT